MDHKMVELNESRHLLFFPPLFATRPPLRARLAVRAEERRTYVPRHSVFSNLSIYRPIRRACLNAIFPPLFVVAFSYPLER